MQKVFISWCGADRDIKNTVYAKMRESLDSDIDIWESDEHCISNFSEECIRNIRESDVFVLLLSLAAQTKSTYVINEVIEARGLECQGKLNIVVYNIDSCALTDAFAMQINHISDANHVKNLRGDNDDNIGVLIDRVKILLKRRADGNPVKPLEVAEPKIVGLPIINNNYYVQNSRDDVLAALNQALQNNSVVFVNELCGYGRKSVAKIYAYEYASEYDYALELHTYCDSISEFLAKGIQFDNISDEIYANLDEKQIILKKLELLKQLVKDCGKKVLLMAPYVKIARSDMNDFVYSCLNSMPVKIMFVTETVPKDFSDRFATIYVGKMENTYLRQLFFHYVDVDDYSKNDISPVLNGFFDSIGGHTAAVELTAKTVADEFGLDTNDIVEALDKVRPDTDNDLSQRIYSAYANLFSLKQFDASQLKVLSILSLVLDRPVSETFVVDMLKSCGAYDGATLKALCNMGWVKRDTLSKTLNIETIIANVCLADNSVDEQTLAKCLSFLAGKLTSLDLVGEAVLSLHFCSKIYKYINADAFAAMCDITCNLLSATVLRKSIIEDVDEAFCDKVEEERSEMDELFCEASDTVISIFGFLLKALGNIDDDKDVFSRRDFVDGYLKAANEIDDDVAELIDESGILGKIYIDLVSNQENITADKVVKIIDYLTENKQKLLTPDEQSDDEGGFFESEEDCKEMLAVIGQLLAMVTNKMVFGMPKGMSQLNLQKAWVKFVDAYSDIIGKTLVYQAHAVLLVMMDSLNYDAKEKEKEIALCLSLLNRHKESLFASKEIYNAELPRILLMKVGNLIELSSVEEAIQTLINVVNNYSVEDCASDIIDYVDGIADVLNKKGDFENVEKLISAVFTPKFVGTVAKQGDKANDELAKISAYLELFAINEEEIFDENIFVEEKQTDYYEQFGLETCDKRTYKVYEAICCDVEKYDYADLSQQQLIDKALELKERAKKLEDWKEIAPEAFALVSEAGYRMLGFRHHWVQYFGACCMLDGNIAQILNGEGKTYTILLVAFVHYLMGRRVDIVDSSEHLCRRNYNWVGFVLKYLGVKVGLLADDNMTARGSLLSSACDVKYVYLNAFMFALLNSESNLTDRSLIGDVAIVDEADDVMIEKGYRSFQLTGNTKSQTAFMPKAVYAAIRQINDDTEQYFIIDNRGSIKIKPDLYKLVESIHSETDDPDINWEVGLNWALYDAIKAFYMFERDRDYYIEDGKILVEDTQSGSLNVLDKGNLAYFIARKENLFAQENTYDKFFASRETIAYQTFSYLCRNVYKYTCGTTATAMSMKNEFARIYDKKVICVPPNKPSVRIDHSPRVFIRKAERDNEVVTMIEQMHKVGRPVLAITSNMYEAEKYSQMLKQMGIGHVVLNARNAADEERVLANCGRLGAVTIATAIANRGVDIALGGSASFIAKDRLRGGGVADEDIAFALSGDNSAFSRSIALNYVLILKETIAEVERNREKVQDLGGLAVICTSCFDELRVEQQARGRCGRQGQKGESWVFVALEDDTMKRVYGPMLARFTNMNGEFDSDMLNKVIKKVRDKIQSLTYNARFETGPLIYTDPYREKIVGLAYAYKNGDIDIYDLRDEYILDNTQFIKRLQRGELTETERKIIKLVRGSLEKLPARRAELIAELKKAFTDYFVANQLNVMTDQKNCIFAKLIYRHWVEFFNDVWKQYDILSTEYKDNPSALDKKMRQYADTRCEENILRAIYDIISTKIRSRFSGQ